MSGNCSIGSREKLDRPSTVIATMTMAATTGWPTLMRVSHISEVHELDGFAVPQLGQVGGQDRLPRLEPLDLRQPAGPFADHRDVAPPERAVLHHQHMRPALLAERGGRQG